MTAEVSAHEPANTPSSLAAGPADPSTDPARSPAAAVAVALAPAAERSAAASTAAPMDGPTWPCLRCGTANSFEATACRGCAAPFLSDPNPRPALVLPLIGDLTAHSRGQRMAIALGASTVLAAVCLGLFALVGMFL